MNLTPAILIVSHSRDLALAMSKVLQSLNPDVRIEYCGGNNRGGLGTDPQAIASALQRLTTNVTECYVVADMGSARLCVQEILDTQPRGRSGKATLLTGPFFESAIELVTRLKGNNDRDRTGIETMVNLSGQDGETGTPKTITRSIYLPFSDGLHARPAAGLAKFFSQFDAEILLQGVDAKSILELLKLQIARPQQVELEIRGFEANQVISGLEEYLKQI